MSNNSKVILLQRQNMKNITTQIKEVKVTKKKLSDNLIKEVDKLKNPKNGQIYVYLQNDDYLFYQFNGKEWNEIK